MNTAITFSNESPKVFFKDGRLVTTSQAVADYFDKQHKHVLAKEGANKRGNSSRLTQSFHFFMFEPIFSPVNALNQPI